MLSHFQLLDTILLTGHYILQLLPFRLSLLLMKLRLLEEKEIDKSDYNLSRQATDARRLEVVTAQ